MRISVITFLDSQSEFIFFDSMSLGASAQNENQRLVRVLLIAVEKKQKR